MEWVETTGRSVQEAKEAALDELGVDEADAEFEVVAEAQTGLFGRLRSEARVRARVRPTAPRAKEDRRNRDRRRRGAGKEEAMAPGAAPASSTANSGPAADDATATATHADNRSATSENDDGAEPATAGASGRPSNEAAAPDSPEGDRPAGGGRSRSRNRKRGGTRPGGTPSAEERLAAETGDDEDVEQSGKGPEVEVDMERQGQVAADFLTQLTAEFGLEASINVARLDEDTVEVQLSGSDLGILIGPKGATLIAVQNLTRTVVFNETGGNNGHINVDVGGYRQKRTQALVRFATQVAEQVKTSGDRTALEPMTSIDRKVVHDTISEIDGVSTISEGEEPRRRVVVLPG